MQSSVIGDFYGIARIFRNINKDGTVHPKLMASLNVGSSVRCIHYHNYVDNFVLIGSMEGNLIGLNLPNISEIDKITECTIVYTVKGSISCINTAPIKENPSGFYVIICDNVGYIHILKGTQDLIVSYHLMMSIKTCSTEIWSMCINPFIDVLPETQFLNNIVLSNDDSVLLVY